MMKSWALKVYYSGLGCKKRDEILKHIAELKTEKKEGKAND